MLIKLVEVFRTLSWGRITFNLDYNIVLKIDSPGLIELSKSGNWLNTRTATLSEYTAIGGDPTRFKHHIFIMQRYDDYGGGGDFNAGMYTDNKVSSSMYIKSSYVSQRNLWLHEWGHNMGLPHSGSPGNVYGDSTCMMGGSYSWEGAILPNCVMGEYLSIYKPIRVINLDELKTEVELVIKGIDVGNDNYVRIDDSKIATSLFISYTGSTYLKSAIQKVLLHRSRRRGGGFSTLIALLDSTKRTYIPTTSEPFPLSITYLRSNATEASVSIRRTVV